MVIRFPVRKKSGLLEDLRLESHPSGLNRTDARRLSRREVEHRERMLEHLHRTSLIRGASPLGLPYTVARGDPGAPLRARGSFAALTRPTGLSSADPRTLENLQYPISLSIARTIRSSSSTSRPPPASRYARTRDW